MSTRCQIEFRERVRQARKTVRDDRRMIYQHSDGYPEGDCGVIVRLVRFFEWEGNGREFDIEYSPANYVYWSKCRDIESVRRDTNGQDMTQVLKNLERTGYGVCLPDDFHCDISFFYEVLMDRSIQGERYRSRLAIRPYSVAQPDDRPIVRSDLTAMNEVVVWENEQRRKP